MRGKGDPETERAGAAVTDNDLSRIKAEPNMTILCQYPQPRLGPVHAAARPEANTQAPAQAAATAPMPNNSKKLPVA